MYSYILSTTSEKTNEKKYDNNWKHFLTIFFDTGVASHPIIHLFIYFF